MSARLSNALQAVELDQIEPKHDRAWLVLACWIAALAAALDAPVARAVHGSQLTDFMRAHRPLREIVKAPGEYWLTVLVIVAVLFHPAKWRAAVLVFAGTAVGSVPSVTKWFVGRTRPFKLHENLAEPFVLTPFPDGLHGLFYYKNLCFPSGHVTLAFATAAAISILLPRWRWIFYTVAALVAAERVAENAHWLSDVVAAAALGVGGVWVIRRAWWDKVCRKSTHG